MKFHTALPIASLLLILLFGCFYLQPPPTVEQRIWLQVPVADQARNHCRFHPSLMINVKKSGQMLDFDGKPMNQESLREALIKFAKIKRPHFSDPRVTIRADRNSSVKNIRLIYEEALKAGYYSMNFRVYSTERR